MANPRMPNSYVLPNMTGHDINVVSISISVQDALKRKKNKKICFPEPETPLFAIELCLFPTIN